MIIFISIIQRPSYRVWLAAAVGQGTSNKCHYKRAWDWRAPAPALPQHRQQSAVRRIETIERLCCRILYFLLHIWNYSSYFTDCALCSRCWWLDYLLWLPPSGRTPGCQIPTRSLHQTEKQKPFWSTPRLHGFIPLHCTHKWKCLLYKENQKWLFRYYVSWRWIQ